MATVSSAAIVHSVSCGIGNAHTGVISVPRFTFEPFNEAINRSAARGIKGAAVNNARRNGAHGAVDKVLPGLLGGNIAGRTNTLSLEIFNCVSRGDFDEATKLCAVLAGVSLVIYLSLELLQSRAR